MIRQNADGSVAVLVRILEVLTAVTGCELDPKRRASLRRHAGLVLADAGRSVPNTSDLDDVRRRHAAFEARHRAAPPRPHPNPGPGR